MKKVFILLIILLMVNGAMTQSCLPNGITFTTQSQIDSFQINYPTCTQIEGYVIIQGNDITNLNGLSVLTSIGGELGIYNNDTLTSLTGLNNVTSIGSDLQIDNNDALTSLTGLEGMTSIAGDLGIYDNSTLTSLTGLNNLTSIRGVWIIWNYALSSLTGLDNIDAGSVQGLYIHNNYTLSTCAVQSICDYLISPNGTTDIHDNATGCNSQQEVEDSCASIGIESLTPESSLTIYPNPTSTNITIKTSTTGTINIINSNGQQLLQLEITEPSTTINVNALPSGVYFVRMTNERTVELGKFIKP